MGYIFCYFFFIWLYIARILFRLLSSRAPRLQGRVGRCGSGSALSVLFGWLWLALLIYLWDVIIPDLSPPFFAFALFRSLFSYLGRWESDGRVYRWGVLSCSLFSYISTSVGLLYFLLFAFYFTLTTYCCMLLIFVNTITGLGA